MPGTIESGDEEEDREVEGWEIVVEVQLGTEGCWRKGGDEEVGRVVDKPA